MKIIKLTGFTLLIGAAIGYGLNSFFFHHDMLEKSIDSKANKDKKPLYWVAPMDANYKRDKPGKSPMGMDLIPIYANEKNTPTDLKGTVLINPAVENNLGITTAIVEYKPMLVNIEAVGYIAFDESLLWQTNVRVAGWVENLFINAVGEKVNQGDVLFTLYSPELVKAQEELLNAYRTKRKQLIKGATERLISLGVDKEQIKQIVKRGLASQTIEIKAISDGIIASLNIREGAYLSPAQAVISAGPLNQVWVDAQVFERQAHWIKEGLQANMNLDALPGKTWQGKIDYVYPILDPKTRTLRVRLKFDNPDGQLKPNMFANISLNAISEQAVLTIPQNAVIRSGNMDRVVLALGEGKYRSARIDVGRETMDSIEVLQGLSEHDKIVTSAHFLLDSESSQSADLSRINGFNLHEIHEGITADPAEHIHLKNAPDQSSLPHDIKHNHKQNAPSQSSLPHDIKHNDRQNQNSPNQSPLADDIKHDDQQNQTKSSFLVQKGVWVRGKIRDVMASHQILVIDHEPVLELNWPGMVMNFILDDKLDMNLFEIDQLIDFKIKKTSMSQYKIMDIQITATDKKENSQKIAAFSDLQYGSEDHQ